MTGKRASLSLSTPNEEWIQGQIASGKFSNRSEVVNDLIRRVREVEMIRQRLIAAEQSLARYGWVDKSPEEMLDGFKVKARLDDKL